LIIIGGTYREFCNEPQIDYLFGSGLRSALALSRACEELKFISVVYEKEKSEANEIASSFGFITNFTERSYPIHFFYDTPISQAKIISPDPLMLKQYSLDVSDDSVLVFSMLEATVNIRADRLVIDPQGLWNLSKQITWSATHVAIVGNYNEILQISEKDENASLDDCVKYVQKKYNVEVVVVKCGALGAIVFEKSKLSYIGVFPTTKVNPLGSGDIFSAVFAYYWGKQKMSPYEAANLASRATATWVSRPPFQILDKNGKIVSNNISDSIYESDVLVYLAGPFFTLSERWLINTCRDALKGLGAKVFSPIHDVGDGPPEKVAPGDLKGLIKADAILALLDGLDAGTVFEIGYAKALGKPIVGFVSEKKKSELTMLEGSNINIFTDLSSAVYNSIWQAMIDKKSKPK
jgi:hypothetical protein